MKRLGFLVVMVSVLGLLVTPTNAAQRSFPSSVPLPDGFYPEGIAIGAGKDFYVGSLLDGAIYKGDLRSGEGMVIVPGAEGRVVAGLSFDARSGLLWAAGLERGAGAVFAVDGRTGGVVAQLAVPGVFLNDLVVTRTAIYITDSLNDVLWVIPLDNRGRPAGPARAVPLTGDFTFVTDGELPINLNGIVATPNGKSLLAVHSTLGLLYRINPATGETTEIDLGGDVVPSGDGLLLHGRTLYVVQNFLNQVAVVELDPGLTRGEITRVITSDLFRVPTTVARFGSSLYLVNARFDVAFPPLLGGDLQSLDYDVVRVRR